MRNEKTKDIKQLDGEKIVRTYSRFDLVLKEGKGAMVTDEDGNQLVDFTSGIGVTALGYCDDNWLRRWQTKRQPCSILPICIIQNRRCDWQIP